MTIFVQLSDMKKLVLIFVLGVISVLQSQEKLGRPFITGEINLSLAVNEYYTVTPNDGEPLLVPSGLFLRVGFGYEFRRKLALSLNAGFDDHWRYDTNAFPAYAGLKYNLFERNDDTFFTEFRYGKMWRPSSFYPDGNYYGFGLGLQAAGEGRWNTIFRIDFHRKGIIGFENDRIDSISVGLGFSFF